MSLLDDPLTTARLARAQGADVFSGSDHAALTQLRSIVHCIAACFWAALPAPSIMGAHCQADLCAAVALAAISSVNYRSQENQPALQLMTLH